VVHHALCNVIEPVLERSMIFDTYANRKGKGTHKAIDRYQEFCRKKQYVLKCDVKKFFPSIDHEILKRELRKKIACAKTLWLIDAILDNSNPQEAHLAWFPGDDLFTPGERRRGLPIGNLTSQLFGNYYLSGLDHFIKETLGCKYYVRYVDDFVVLDDDKGNLQEIKAAIDSFLQGCRLLLHENKSRVYRVKDGVGFLGHRVFPGFRLVKSENVRRFRKRLKGMLKEYWAGSMTRQNFNARVRCWFAHIAHSNTWRLRRKIYISIYGEKLRNDEKISSSFQVSDFLLRQGGETLA
jgi:retron-type reverse transcriptase